MKPICVKCRRFYRPKRNGFRFIEGMPAVQGAKPGTAEPDNWKPYKLWVGDLWSCEGCDHEVVAGVAPTPIAEHYQPGFASAVERSFPPGEVFQINDC